MSTRTVTYDLTLISGSAAASKVVTFDLLTPYAARSADTVVQITFSSTSDENGAGTVTLAVPSSGAYLYSCTLPDGQSFRFSLAAGSATTLHALMAATVGSTVTSADAITAAIDSHNTDTTDVHGITDTSALVTTSDYTAADVLTKLLTVDGTGTGLDADTVDGSHASAFEAALGNPDSDGYVLSSTAAGVRSWVQSAADVGDLTTTTGSSTDMLRVAAAGGLEYRTTAQVLSDIGAAPTASPTFTGTVTLPTTVASVIKPASDSTTALQLANAAGTAVLTVDTTNGRVGVGTTPNAPLHVYSSTGQSHFYVEGEASGYPLIYVGGSSSSVAGIFRRITTGASLYFGEDTDAGGVYFRGTGGVYISSANAGGSVFARVTNASSNATGNLAKLVLSPHSGFTSDNSPYIASYNDSNWAGLAFATNGSSLSEKMRIDPDGNVGIGTTSPTALMHLAASTTSRSSLRIASGTAPTTPNDGDIWYDGSNLKIRIGATTYNVDVTAV